MAPRSVRVSAIAPGPEAPSRPLAAALHVSLDELAAACAHHPDWQEPALSA
ncbi:hypothetical protein AB0N14_26395 [Streptomyces sp. NPDC051104]|uniref:hypothetical protein n=1 Tax=Streptomyces sp. NPDC051104 TaxID=3155044 RepID=UPI003433D8FB